MRKYIGTSLFAVLTIMVAAIGFYNPSSSAAPIDTPPNSEFKFETPSSFYDNFDMGVSGMNQLNFGDGIHSFRGDHDHSCSPPDQQRTVNWVRTPEHQPEMFWHCAPGNDPAKGHVMTAIDTTGYDHAWFSPKQVYTNTQQVCFDVNHTSMSHRKWLELQFVDARPGQDATRYPSAKATGGFDLGYTNPSFRQDAPNTGIFPASGNLAGMQFGHGIFKWFQNQSQWTGEAGWPGRDTQSGRPLVTDKAGRYRTCFTNKSNGTIEITEVQSPSYVPIYGAVRTLTVPGQIPQHPVRIVWHDANYDPIKDVRYSADRITWHWDNVQVWSSDTPTTTTTVAPTTTTEPPTTTTQPPTTTTQPPTTTTPPAGPALEWRVKGTGFDGYLGTELLFKVRKTNTFVDRPYRLQSSLGFRPLTYFATVDEARAEATNNLNDFLRNSGLQ